MPHVRVNGVNLFYTDQGSGEETVVFSHGLLWSHVMFEKQVELLKKKYRVIAYDHRGQGSSEVREPFDMDTLGDDAAELIKKLVGEAVHFIGLSMGGFTGMRLAARYPELVKSLVLLETSANAEPVENHPKYKTLNGLVKWFGVLPMIANQVMPIMFAKSWLDNPDNKEEIKRWKSELRKNKKSITKPVEGVIFRSGVEDELGNIRCPTMIIVGDEDVATKPEKAKFIQMGIKDSVLHRIIGAGHSSCIEKPEKVNALISEWLEKY
ncbi:alpha/beta fold hydrolase [Algoriphagus sediminis]|uniref:Alpha/beta hydrolase n=1 Tax=Algoriphagus sediminis TaxID=3057113 RepID=A0ABT7YGY6_9BACT|nr:alpha/beta hydrolase [Algoriphagus sediminis]MDN3205454.1 alpha/beta hydrolase [Algoriphagus sediminis]